MEVSSALPLVDAVDASSASTPSTPSTVPRSPFLRARAALDQLDARLETLHSSEGEVFAQIDSLKLPHLAMTPRQQHFSLTSVRERRAISHADEFYQDITSELDASNFSLNGEERKHDEDVTIAAGSADSSSGADPTSTDLAAAAAKPGGGISQRLTFFLSWASLLIAVVSMSAVGPMFLYLEKKHIASLLAVVWRQSWQVIFLLPPTAWEWWKIRKSHQKQGQREEEVKWWKQRVKEAEDKEEEEEEIINQDEGFNEEVTAEPSSIELSTSPQSASPSSSLSPNGYQADGGALATEDPATTSNITRIEIESFQTETNESPDSALSPSPSPTTTSTLITHSTDEVPALPQTRSTLLPSKLTAAKLAYAQSFRSNPFYQMSIISFCWFVSLALWVISLPFTSAARASLLTSLYPIFIIIYLRLWKKVPVSLGEFLGVAVCMIGISSTEILSGLDPDTHTIAAEEGAAGRNSTSAPSGFSSFSPVQLQLFGDWLCIVSGLFISGEVILSSNTRKLVPLFQFTFLTSCFVLFMLICSTLIFEGSEISMHPTQGIFGWMDSGEMAFRIILFGFVVGMIGILGFNYAVSYINPIIFSTVQLLDPGISGIMSALFGIEGWPVISTYIGVIVITAGIFIVVIYQTRRENRQELEKMQRKEARKSQWTY